MGLTFRLCVERDAQKLVLFHREARGFSSTQEFWIWKYFENPAGPSCVSVALDGERVVGRLGFIPIRVRIGSKYYLAAQQVDSDILESYRKGGTYFRLARIVEIEGNKRGLAFGFGFSIATTKEISTEALGFSVVTPVARTVKVIDHAYYITERLKIPLMYPLGRYFESFIKWREQRLAIEGVDTQEIHQFGKHFNDLWENATLGKIMVVKDSAYLNWRYFKCPTTKYKIYAASENGKLKGFIVFQSKLKNGIKYGIIADLLCIKNNPKIVESLLLIAIKSFINNGAVSIICWMPKIHNFYPILLKRGFRERLTKVYLLIVPNKNSDISVDVLKNGKNWFYMLGDSDLHLN